MLSQDPSRKGENLIPRSHLFDFGDFRIEYLDEYEAICETALARGGGLIYEKTESREPRDTARLNF
jgi:hypothetical protein